MKYPVEIEKSKKDRFLFTKESLTSKKIEENYITIEHRNFSKKCIAGLEPYHLGKYIGEGNGIVMEVCDPRNECPWVANIIPIDDENHKKALDNDVYFHKLMSDLGIATAYIYDYVCGNGFLWDPSDIKDVSILISERMNANLGMYSWYYPEEFLLDYNDIYRMVMEKVIQMNNYILHGMLAFTKILVKIDQNKRVEKVAIIEYYDARNISDVPISKRRDDINTVNRIFQELKEEALEILKRKRIDKTQI